MMGINLFDPAKSNFNKVWRADKAMLAVARRTRTEPHIIVGIWAPGVDRYRQYLPRPIYDAASPALRAQMDRLAGGPIVSDSYLHWIANGLKPWVDAHFRTLTGPHDTMIAGSSMGGLMSCYAFMARPDIFGQAACVSSNLKHQAHGEPLQAFSWNDLGEMLGLGIGQATITGMGLTLAGAPAFQLRRLAYMARMPGLPQQLRVAGGWLANWL